MAMYKGETKIKDIYVGTEPIVKVYAGEEFCGFFTLSAYNLVANSDLLKPKESPNENEPLGFDYTNNVTDISLSNGIAEFTLTSSYSGLRKFNISTIAGDKWYAYTYIRSTGTSYLDGLNSDVYLSSSSYNEWTFLSKVSTSTTTLNNYIGVFALQNVTVEVDYIGAINITDLVSRGILPSGLTDAQYKTILDNYFNS